MGIPKKQKPEFTDPRKCGHCGNFAPMIRGAVYSTVEPTYDQQMNATFDEGLIYQILDCPSCGKVTLTKLPYHDLWSDGEDAPEMVVLFPTDDKLPVGLPDTIKKAYEAALKVRNIDANAYGVLVGRVLEMVCENREAKGKDMNSKLADLASKGEIPSNLVGVANGLRNLRNVGAHAALGELTSDEVPILSSLTKAILEYVYSAPHLARIAQEKLDKLKKKHK
ncbi:MAG: DUF4145 domain-containing protein [Bacteroidetes bacterium]|nr:DUF4145 domain-containing protein [Bacteroidota bacterium]